MKDKLLTPSEAVEYAKQKGIELSKPTVIKYAFKHGLGYQLGGKGGKWFIFESKFRRFISGQDSNSKK